MTRKDFSRSRLEANKTLLLSFYGVRIWDWTHLEVSSPLFYVQGLQRGDSGGIKVSIYHPGYHLSSMEVSRK